jgi:hypothetical protein
MAGVVIPPASGFRSPVDSTGVPANMAGMLGETGIPTRELSEVEGRDRWEPRYLPAVDSLPP